MLTVEVARKVYRDRGGRQHLALGEMHLRLHPGEWVCLVGPSGCGKTTLLNIIGGLDRQFSGRLQFDEPPRLGMVFQSPRLMPWLTALQNVALVVRDGERAAAELLGALEMSDALHAYPNSLSGGMQRRVALARAFVIEPTLLLLDEPLVSLDAPVAARLRSLMLRLWQQRRTTVLYVTHDLREALALGDRVCFMSAAPGRIVREVQVTLPRPRLPESEAIGALHATMLAEHPQLLAGVTGADVEAAYG